MKKQIRIFLAGAMVVIPFAITIWLITAVGSRLDALVNIPFDRGKGDVRPFPPGAGAVIVVAFIYLVGVLTHFWVFRAVVSLAEKLVTRVPGIKTIYESVRDLMKVFGGDTKRMGRVVIYRPPGADAAMLGVVTNEDPPGAKAGREVAVYFPLGYMIGGPVMYVSPEHLQDVDISVEHALKLCATAQVGEERPVRRRKRPAADQPDES